MNIRERLKRRNNSHYVQDSDYLAWKKELHSSMMKTLALCAAVWLAVDIFIAWLFLR